MFSKTDIEKYFNAEKAESWVFMAIGIAGIFLAIIFFFFIKTNLYKGMAIPFALLGILLGVVGFTVYRSSDKQRIDNVYAMDMNPRKLREVELPRMKKVMKNFLIYRYVEIFLFLIGAGLYIYFIRDYRQDFWRGFGFALAIMALLALAADYFAEKRGHIYTNGIESYLNNK